MTASTLALVVIAGAAGLLLSVVLMFAKRDTRARRHRRTIDPLSHTRAKRRTLSYR
jgi:hypothetical protein